MFSYHWKQDNKTFRPSDHNRMNVKMRCLKIKKVRKVDADLYTCVVMNKCGEKNFLSMHLYVHECKLLIIVRSITKYTILCLFFSKKNVGNFSDTQLKGNTKEWMWNKFYRGSMKNLINRLFMLLPAFSP